MKNLRKTKYMQFGWKHILMIFLALIIFQVFVSNLQQNTLRDLLSDTMDWYKQNSAEQIANLTTTSLELLLESDDPVNTNLDEATRESNLVHALNSILKQPLMKRNVEAMCVILPHEDKFVAMDLGQSIYSYFYRHHVPYSPPNSIYEKAVEKYSHIHVDMMKSELTTSFQEEENVFHVYVPLVPYGEYAGAVYLKIHPDVAFISEQILSSFNKTVLIFSSLIILGFLSMFYISTNIVMERDEAREQLYKEREEHLQEHIAQQKEHLFTKRIYHTHHKAEKVMGFINEDLEALNEKNFNQIKYCISKYANFISRVIYDMKWYNPPIQTMRSNIFRTDLNEVLNFIVNNIFLRISNPVRNINFEFNLDKNLPLVGINEFVVWEIVEPLIQNSIDHSNSESVIIKISTEYHRERNKSIIKIEDNGKGIRSDLLDLNESGVRRIFLENISTKEEDKNCGYGCYLSYEISKRCGWLIDAYNNETGGAVFTIDVCH